MVPLAQHPVHYRCFWEAQNRTIVEDLHGGLQGPLELDAALVTSLVLEFVYRRVLVYQLALRENVVVHQEAAELLEVQFECRGEVLSG